MKPFRSCLPAAQAVVWIPSELAYGDRDMGRIKPNTNLVFELHILEPEK